jgi:hypothetical protein
MRPPSSEAYVYTALAVPKTELSTTEWASRCLRCWGPVMAPPLVAMPPIIMVPIFSSRCDPGMPARRGRSGSALGAPVTGSRSQHDRCDGYKTHFHDPYPRFASDDTRWLRPRMHFGCNVSRSGLPFFLQDFSFHGRCGDEVGSRLARLKSEGCERLQYP